MQGPRRATEQDTLLNLAEETARTRRAQAVSSHDAPVSRIPPYTGHDSLNYQDVSISPLSTPFENVKWIGPCFGNTENSQRLFSNTEMFRAFWGPHAKSETTFVAPACKVAVRMWSQIGAARIILVRSKNAMQNGGGPRTAHPRLRPPGASNT